FLLQAAILILLGVFWTQTSALQTFVLNEPNNDYVTATMTISNEKNFADVHVRSGLYSSDTIFDYSHGYVATRLFSRNACFILKISEASIPELQEIGRLKVYSPQNVWVQFQSGNSVFGNIKDWFLYGKPIEQLCKGLPLYKLVKTEQRNCASAGIPTILGINICEKLQKS
uniref:Gastrokine-2 n=1 Tax=Anser cygnoides TaxID=8845 RepID=A0A8B9EQP2_ANSCY